MVLPAVSFAGMPDFNGPFVICGTSTTDPCTLCDIFKMAQLIIDTIIGFLGFIAVPFLIVVGGFMILLHGASPDLVTKGKTVIKNAIIGFIIALLAWTIINMIFLALAGGDNGVGKIFNAPWNEIKCEGGGINEDGDNNEVTPGKYCVCETPVYDLNPNDSTASIIGTNAKVYSDFADQEECVEKCVSANAPTYCHPSLKMDAAKLYCADLAGLDSKSACTLKKITNNCRIGNCSNLYNSKEECVNASKTTFKSTCFLDGQELCRCDTTAGRSVCNKSSSTYVIYQIYKENPTGSDTDLSGCGGTSDTYCRLNCQYPKCDDGSAETSVCDEIKDSFACFDGYTCKKMIESQTTDACYELKQILNCMKGKLDAPDKIITSISDNSPDAFGALGRCFNPTSNWKLCGSSKDSCGGECCGHSLCSLHYGGKARSDFGSGSILGSTCGIGGADCRKCSWAVDFANGTSFDNLKKATEDCAEELWDGNMEEIYILKEGNHNHLQLNGVAKYHKCK